MNEFFGKSYYKEAQAQEWIKATDLDAPYFCAEEQPDSFCECNGTVWFGPRTANDTGNTIKTFDEFMNWNPIAKFSQGDMVSCGGSDFGLSIDGKGGHQCFCEPYQQPQLSRCALEGEDCQCKGIVAYGAKGDGQIPYTFEQMLEHDVVLTMTNKSGVVSCWKDDFMGVDPAPEGAKQCFCDENEIYYTQEDVDTDKDLWKAIKDEQSYSQQEKIAEEEAAAALKEAAEEAKAAAEAAKQEAAAKEAARLRAEAEKKAEIKKAEEEAKRLAAEAEKKKAEAEAKAKKEAEEAKKAAEEARKK